jgi:phosphatidylinositol alpha-1,6-mannosyltransferase
MKALLINIGFVPQVGGSYRLLYEAARRLPNGSVDVLASHCLGDTAFDRSQALRIMRSRAYTLRDPGALFSILRKKFPARADRLEQIVKRLRVFALIGAPAVGLRTLWQVLTHRYDLILAGQVLTTGWLAWTLHRLTRIRYGTFVYGEEIALDNRYGVAARLMMLGLSKADWIVACSEATKVATARADIPTEKIHVLLPAVDTELFRPGCQVDNIVARYNLAGRKVILSVGRLIERKGFDQVIRALPQIKGHVPELVYIIRGEGPDKDRLFQLAQALHVLDSIRFIDDLDYNELPALYCACDVFAMPNRVIAATGEQEGFGIVFLEASSCGKPVIGGKSGGAVDAIADGRTGFLIDPANVDELADKIEQLLADRALADRLGRTGRQWVIENFSWDRYAERLWQLMSA